MTAPANDYRNWLWAYPRGWREHHGEVLTGILAESAASGDKPGAKDWLNLAWSGLGAQLRSYGVGVRERSGTTIAMLRRGAQLASVPAIILAFALLFVDFVGGLVSARPGTGYATSATSVWTVPTQPGPLPTAYSTNPPAAQPSSNDSEYATTTLKPGDSPHETQSSIQGASSR